MVSSKNLFWTLIVTTGCSETEGVVENVFLFSSTWKIRPSKIYNEHRMHFSPDRSPPNYFSPRRLRDADTALFSVQIVNSSIRPVSCLEGRWKLATPGLGQYFPLWCFYGGNLQLRSVSTAVVSTSGTRVPDVPEATRWYQSQRQQRMPLTEGRAERITSVLPFTWRHVSL